MSPSLRRSVFFAALASMLVVSVLSPVSAQADPPGPPGGPPAEPGGGPPFDPLTRGQAAVDRLGDRLPEVARAYGVSSEELGALLVGDATLALDPNDELLYLDVLAPGETVGATSVDGPVAAPSTDGPEFQLASLPGADKTIYLDFDGHVTTGTTWNSAYGVGEIVSPPYDTNADPETWSAAELQVIRDTWAVVAEDFAPWNVNVTTIEPSVDDLRRSDSGDTRWGARVVFTQDDWSNCGCGGHAYIGAFDDTVDEPTFVYNSSFVGASEAATHEVGHMLGLAHDGTTDGTAYYQGHQGTGQPGWAPIMGVAYYQPVGQWSQQEYTGANNTGSSANYGRGPDDVAIISSLTNGNGFGLRPDDHGPTSNPTVLAGATPSIAGIIATRDDVDAFSFTTSATGAVTFSATGDATSANLDIELTLRDSGGAIVAQDNPVGSLDASVSATVPPGTYTIAIDGVGVGSPFTSPPTGYTDYASLGQYQLTGSIDGVGPPDSEPPAVPTGLGGSQNGGQVQLGWDPNTEPDLAGYVVRRSTSPVGPFTTLASPVTNGFTDTAPVVGANYYVVAARDASGNTSADSTAVLVEVPPSPTREVATGQTPIYGTVSGSLSATHQLDGAAQTITEVHSGGRPANRHDRAEHRWTVPAATGNQTLRVVATATEGGDADDGFAIEWSTDGSVWLPVTMVTPSSPVDATVAIGGPTGTVQVRIVDADRTAGQRGFDAVSIDLIEISGDGGPVDPPPPATNAVASLSVGAQGVGKGRQVGVATVTVVDDHGVPVPGAVVDIVFGGSFDETVTVTTGASGAATATTTASLKKPSVSACVGALSVAGLTWLPGTEAC